MSRNINKRSRWQRRKRGLRKRINGTPDRPRLSVYRSLKQIYAQIIDDLDGKTIVSANSLQLSEGGGGNRDAATAVGKLLAERAKEAGIGKVAFDRNGLRYHGRIRALADAARKEGLEF